MSISAIYPAIRPSLNLDFANVGRLDPRVTFTRASTAGYYDGVTTTKAEQNLLIQSQDFTTTWTGLRRTVTANTEVAPDGTTTADSVTQNSGETAAGFLLQNVSAIAADYVYSAFAKPNGKNFLRLTEDIQTGSGVTTWFDVQNGTVGTTGSGHTATITSVGNGWYRCSIKFTVNAARTDQVYLGLADTDNSTVVVDSGGLYLWGAQLEERSAVTAYTATTTQPITNYVPVLLAAQNDVPRFDHNPVTGAALGLLVEEQRTNVILQSEGFSTGTWSKSGATVTANTVVAPDGTLTADKLVENTATGSHYVVQSPSLLANTVYTLSVYLKAAERTQVTVSTANIANWAVNGSVNVDLSNGTIIGGAGTVTPVGNGWYRVYISATFGPSNAVGGLIIFSRSGGSTSYTGDGYSGVYIWGAQFEAGTFPTSYIKTEAVTVTRAADAASMTGTNFSSWYNAAEGTFHHELNTPNDFAAFANFGASDGTTTNQIGMQLSSTKQVRGIIKSSNTSSFSANLGSIPSGFYKVSMAYKFNDAAICLNGGAVTTDTSVDVPNNMNQISISGQGNSANGYIRKLAYYPSRLSDAQLQALTG